MVFDPFTIEIAKTFFAGISALAASIGVWQKYKDQKEANRTFDITFNETIRSKQADAAAIELVNIIPPEVIHDLEKRAEYCWSSYREVLGGDFLPGEVDKATDSVQACVCRELGRIYRLNGHIPPHWQPQWDRYNCQNR